MNLLRIPSRLALVAVAAVSMAACAPIPSRQADLDYRHRPPTPAQVDRPAADGEGRRLSIQSGEGETLNVPWFVRDAQDWINTY